MSFAGYGMVQSLAPFKMPLIGFSTRSFHPPVYSRYLKKLVYFEDDQDLLEKLKQTAAAYDQKPVLMLTADKFVNLVSENLEMIKDLFLIDFPPAEQVNMLIDKEAFYGFAQQHDFTIPKTQIVKSVADLDIIRQTFTFPVILKPFLRTPAWIKGRFPKAVIIEGFEELKVWYEKVRQAENRVIVQEFIPGGDENVVFCLVYYNKSGQCIGEFTGTKIRQWPVGTGSTAVAVPNEDEQITRLTTDFFDALSYQGFGSMEFKKHDRNGRYYMIEPTVGRADLQEYVATLNGVNLALIAYNALTAKALQPAPKQQPPLMYINELNELKRLLFEWKKNPKNVLQFFQKSTPAKRRYAYTSLKDPLVGLMTGVKICSLFFKKLRKGS
jgi:predicted ATP-grasp superfamily ATP-dependent carboligase